jgi:hypothetical protein
MVRLQVVAGPRNHHIRADLSAQQQGVISGSALATCFPGRQIWIGRVGLSDPRSGLEVPGTFRVRLASSLGRW